MSFNNISDYDWGWVVGVIEGEGYIGSYKDKRRPNSYQFSCRVMMTDEDVVRRLYLLCGGIMGGPYKKKKRSPNGADCKDQWLWKLEVQSSLYDLLSHLRPFLSIRRTEQLDKTMTILKTRPKVLEMECLQLAPSESLSKPISQPWT